MFCPRVSGQPVSASVDSRRPQPGSPPSASASLSAVPPTLVCAARPRGTSGPRQGFHNRNMGESPNAVAQNQEDRTTAGTSLQNRIASLHKQAFFVKNILLWELNARARKTSDGLGVGRLLASSCGDLTRQRARAETSVSVNGTHAAGQMHRHRKRFS